MVGGPTRDLRPAGGDLLPWGRDGARTDDRSVTRPLSPADCWHLLDLARVGRVAFTDRAMPAIAAVPCRLAADDELLLAVPAGSRIAEAIHLAVVAFGVDDLTEGWSVSVVGETRVLDPGTPRPPSLDVPGTILVALSVDLLEGWADQQRAASR